MSLMLAPKRPKARKGHCVIVHPHTTRVQRVEQKAISKLMKRYQDIVSKQSVMAKGSSHGQPGPYFYQTRGKTYTSLPLKMIQGIQQCPHYKQMLKDCTAEGVQLPKNILAQDPRTHILTPEQYLKNVKAGMMPPMRNHNLQKEMAEKATAQGGQMKFVKMEFRNVEQPSRLDTPAPQNSK